MDEHETDKVHAILMDALVAYGDACTLPDLTPSCPYFVQTDAGPSCEEQCRDLVEKFGVARRPVKEVRIEGLVLRGRAMPISVAAGTLNFDANQKFLEHRSLAPKAQSTTSLLLGLESVLCNYPVGDPTDRVDRAFALWCELERRKFPIARVAKATILVRMSANIGTLAAVPAMRSAGVWPSEASSDFLDRLESLSQSGWAAVLKAAIDAEPTRAYARRRALTTRSPLGMVEPFPASFYGDDDSQRFETAVVRRLAADIGFFYALAECFTNRVHEWLCRLLSEDLRALFVWSSPPPPLFLAMQDVPPHPDEIATWIWDHFCHTRLEQWEPSSLLHEGRSHREGVVPLPKPVWQERITDSESVASLALEKATEPAKRHRQPTRSLRPDEFVTAAIDHLESGQVERAADIFEGLADLRPADGDVLNNLGFCLLPRDPVRALEVLQQASLFPHSRVLLSTANRVLALHLTGRDLDAIGLAEESLESNPESGTGPCYLWAHSHDNRPLLLQRLTDERSYLNDLTRHIREYAGLS